MAPSPAQLVRITFLTHYYPPEVGAPQARIAALARHLREGGDEVTVHTCFPHYPDGVIKPPYRNRLLLVEGAGEVPVLRSAVYPASNTGFGRRVASHASFAASALLTAPRAGPADIVVVETPPLFIAGAAIAYARLKRARLVMHVSDLWPESAIELGVLRSRGAIRAARALERRCYRAADALVCPTEGIAEALEGRPEAAGKVRLVRPSVDLEAFEPAAAERRHSGSSRRGPLRVLYAGTIGLAQGVGTLFDAAAELERDDGSQIEVVVAGDGADAAALRARMAEQGPASVSMLGAVPAERVPPLYADADLAVVLLRDRPVFHGALPTKMLEAMAAGCPVVLSAGGEAARFLAESGGGVIVPPEDPSALAQAFRDLAADRERLARLGAAARRRVERGFERGRAVAEWRELLHAATEGATWS